MGVLKYIGDKLFSNNKEVMTEDSIESGNGWTKFPDGTIIQYGKATFDSNNGVAAALPHAQDPARFYSITTTAVRNTADPMVSTQASLNTGGGSMNIWGKASNNGGLVGSIVHWQIIGRWK